MEHYTLTTITDSGTVYLGLCHNTEAETLNNASQSFPQYSNFRVEKCNCKQWNGKNTIPKNWVFPF